MKTIKLKGYGPYEIVDLNDGSINLTIFYIIENYLWQKYAIEKSGLKAKDIKYKNKEHSLYIKNKKALCIDRQHHYPIEKWHLYAIFDYLESVKDRLYHGTFNNILGVK